MIVYIETSAAAKLLVDERESAALAAHMDAVVSGAGRIFSSLLLETELRRLAVREALAQTAVSELLDRVELIEPDRSQYRDAGLLPGQHLRSLDALHVVAALRVAAGAMISYDQRQVAAAHAVGLRVFAPA
ncbi:MAG: PIN domain-containing protein [Actinomycetota bacterium]|nr:PIN domain-containing protein [Actinomycetota bacterium]